VAKHSADPDTSALAFFTTRLMEWYEPDRRPLPWKGEKDPYLVWLSEIILQQTRVEQGLPYFQRFVQRFPRVEDLAAATQDEVMKLWEGLGYYSRARHMHAAARFIAHELDGQFPDTYSGILALKGVGPYTAAAIASFAYDLPHAVVDGNVFRVLSRFFGIEEPIDGTKGKKQFAGLAQQLLDARQPGRYNQAIMDFGATHCTPKRPLCKKCPLREKCRAYQNNRVSELPVKAKKIKKRTRHFHYLIIEQDKQVFIRKRTEKDIWKNLYEFPLIELDNHHRDPERLSQTDSWREMLGKTEYNVKKVSPAYRHHLTHQKIVAVFFEIQLQSGQNPFSSAIKKIDRKNLSKFAFPKLIDCYLRDKSLYLNL